MQSVNGVVLFYVSMFFCIITDSYSVGNKLAESKLPESNASLNGDVVTRVVSTYDSTAFHGKFTDPSLLAFAQRLHLPAQSTFSNLRVLLDGPVSVKACDLVVYAHSGGLIAPRLPQQEVCRFHLAKQTAGYEWVSVDVTRIPVHTGGQLFLSIENRAIGISPITDIRQRETPCTEDNGVQRFDQLTLTHDSVWTISPYAFCYQLSYSYPTPKLGFVRDTTVDNATDMQRMPSQRYISCADLDNDGQVEFSAAGLLYKRSGNAWNSFDLHQNNDTKPLFVFFMDVNNDEKLDVVTAGFEPTSELQWFTIGANNTVTFGGTIPLGAEIIIGSITGFDADHNDKIDVFVGGLQQATPVVLHLQKNGTWQHQYIATQLTANTKQIPILHSLDVDDDGTSELIIRTDSKDVLVTFVGIEPQTIILAESATERNYITDVAQYDSKSIDLAENIAWKQQDESEKNVEVKVVKDDISLRRAGFIHPRYEERLSNVQYVDLDNNGAKEMIRFSEGACRLLSVFSEQSDGTWLDQTNDWGLQGIDDCSDGIFVDVNLDGRIDLILDTKQGVQVLLNSAQIPPAHVLSVPETHAQKIPFSVELQQTHSNLSRGALGRGHLMQEPAQVLLQRSANASDTVHVLWNGKPKTYEEFVIQNSSLPNNIVKGAGKRVKEIPEDSSTPTIVYSGAGRTYIVRGINNQVQLQIQLVRSDGTLVLLETIETLGQDQIEVNIDELTSSDLVSGVYQLVVICARKTAQHSVVIVR